MPSTKSVFNNLRARLSTKVAHGIQVHNIIKPFGPLVVMYVFQVLLYIPVILLTTLSIFNFMFKLKIYAGSDLELFSR